MTDGVILLVDDDLAIVSLTRIFLERDGFVVRTAVNGSEAQTILGSEDVKLLVTDYRMPGMSGIELIQHAQKMYPHVHTALCTADMTLELETIREAGLDSPVLRKPFMFHQVRALAYKAFNMAQIHANTCKNSITV